MPEIQFFQLSEGPVAETLPQILSRAQARGWKVLLRGPSKAALEALDQALWQGQKGAEFRPHALAGTAEEALHPVLLSLDGPTEGRACLICFDGAQMSLDEAQACERSVIIFDGRHEDSVAFARTQWKALTGQGISATYYAQEDGRWVKKAERA